MPAAEIHLIAGHPPAALRQVMLNVSAALTTVLDTTADRVHVRVRETEAGSWLVNGRPASEVLGGWARSEVEAPLVELSVVGGRPVAVLHHLIREVTDGVAHALGARRDLVRVIVHQVDADLWGVGGVPVSVQRAEELSAARLRRTS